MPGTALLDAPRDAGRPRSTKRSPCTRFAWGAAATGGVLFAASMVEAAGTWALSTGAVSLTVASVAGVIAMEGCEEQRAARSRARVRR